ncbi:hypothetical protein [Gordonia alkanivorans]|uniref:hypothetical protein n=1 Tax=Gordonia alkanivorans TaxID=84096 RepID=UPI001E3B4EFF|nr:hypothetical protein [Gordonia alkanivorans]
MSTAWSLDASPLQRLIAVAGATLRFSRTHRALFEAIALSYLSPAGVFPVDTEAAAAIERRRRQQLRRIVDSLDEAIECGEIYPCDTSAAAHFLVASWAGVLTMTDPHGLSDPGAALALGIRGLIAGLAVDGGRADELVDRYEHALAAAGLVR